MPVRHALRVEARLLGLTLVVGVLAESRPRARSEVLLPPANVRRRTGGGQDSVGVESWPPRVLCESSCRRVDVQSGAVGKSGQGVWLVLSEPVPDCELFRGA